jgi:CBS domain-containing protein
MRLVDMMSLQAKTIGPMATVREAAALMQRSNVGFLPVTEGDVPVGVITDRDIVVRALARGSIDSQVRDVMTEQPVTIDESADVSLAMRTMTERRIGRLLVVDGKKHLRGVVSANDVARVSTDHKGVSELVQALGSKHSPASRAATLTKS